MAAQITESDVEEMLDQLRWYENTAAGDGPVGGYAQAGRRAEKFWYDRTLPLLTRLNRIYKDPALNRSGAEGNTNAV